VRSRDENVRRKIAEALRRAMAEIEGLRRSVSAHDPAEASGRNRTKGLPRLVRQVSRWPTPVRGRHATPRNTSHTSRQRDVHQRPQRLREHAERLERDEQRERCEGEPDDPEARIEQRIAAHRQGHAQGPQAEGERRGMLAHRHAGVAVE
jgi:hypothetical protein